MPAQYVEPYVKRGKNDAADAEAICEAVTRPTMLRRQRRLGGCAGTQLQLRGSLRGVERGSSPRLGRLPAEMG